MEYGKPIVVERPKFGMWATPAAEVAEANKKHRSKRRMSSVRKRHSGRWKTLKQVELRITRPKIHLDLSDAALREEVRRQVVGLEAKADKARQKSGRRVLGMRRVEKQHWNALPSQREDMFGPEPAAAGWFRPPEAPSRPRNEPLATLPGPEIRGETRPEPPRKERPTGDPRSTLP